MEPLKFFVKWNRSHRLFTSMNEIIIMNDLLNLFLMPFVIRSLLAGIAVSISMSLLGTFLVLKRFSLIGDGLAHVSFFAVALSLLLNETTPWISMIILSIASIIIMKFNESGRAFGDAAIGMIGAVSIALGTILVQYISNQYVNLENYLFGEIFLVRESDVWFAWIIAITIIIFTIVLYQPLFALTFEEDFAKVKKVPVQAIQYGLAIITALAIFVGIRVVGTLLISSLIIFPTVTAMQWNKSFKGTLISSVFISLTNILIGFVLSILLAWPAGSTMVVVSGATLLLVYVFQGVKRRLQK
jgi:zinc transport system permease protein